MNYEIDERGWFWWHDQPLPEGCFAPKETVSGTLRVGHDGIARLELDGLLDASKSTIAAFLNEGARSIQGKLKNSGLNILMIDATPDGGTASSMGVSFQKFVSFECLTSNQRSVEKFDLTGIDRITIHVSNLDFWLNAGNITVSRNNRGAEALCVTPSPYVFQAGTQSLTIEHFLESPYPRTNMSLVFLTDKIYFIFKDELITLQQAEEVYRVISDFVLLLSDCAVTLEWPSVSKASGSFRYYFARGISVETEWERNHCLTTLPQTRDRFGKLFFSWKQKREIFGSAFYLLLGYKRQKAEMYAEHSFVNLAWAIEAYDRVRKTSKSSTSEIQRATRMVASLSDAKDRKWLAKRLKFAGEPSLEQRIFASLSDLNLDIDEARMRVFAGVCAGLRNEISHFGGPRQSGANYQDFCQKLRRFADALESLYHLALLNEIGCEPDIIQHAAFRSFKSFELKHRLSAVGLVDMDWGTKA